jgi:protein arginine kinase activator
MLCERCGQRPATVHFTEIANGQKQDTHLCEVCAREIQPQGFGFAPQLMLHNFLAGLLNHELGGTGYNIPEATGKNCEKCGMAEGQFIRQGLLGCGDCYPHFEEKLLPLLRRIHGNTRHTGKVPERTGGRARLVKEVERMKSQLREVVAREEFERAAQLRDQIRQMEKSLAEGSEG